MKRLNQSGSHVLAVALFVLALGVIGYAGYKVQQSHSQNSSVASTNTTSKTATVPKAITNTATLTQAANALDSSSTQLNSGLNDGALNADLNDML